MNSVTSSKVEVGIDTDGIGIADLGGLRVGGGLSSPPHQDPLNTASHWGMTDLT